MIRKSLLLGIAALMALGVFALSGDTARAVTGVGSMTAMSIDMDPTGNTNTSVGTIEDCVQAAAGATVTVNIVAQGIPVGYEMIAFISIIGMDDTVLSVGSVDDSNLIGAAAGSSPISGSESPPDSDGSPATFNVSAADTGPIPGSSESGDGILAILGIDINAAAADGLYSLVLSDSGHADTGGINTWEPNVYNHGAIAVGAEVCPTFVQGDVDCNGAVNSVDSLKILRRNAGLPVAQNDPCDDIGTGTPIMGDVDCGGTVTSVDSLKILRHNAGLPVTQIGPEPDACPNIGT